MYIVAMYLSILYFSHQTSVAPKSGYHIHVYVQRCTVYTCIYQSFGQQKCPITHGIHVWGTYILSLIYVWRIYVYIHVLHQLSTLRVKDTCTCRELKRLSSVTLSPVYAHFSETLSGVWTIRALRATERFILNNQSKLDINQRANYGSKLSMYMSRSLTHHPQFWSDVLLLCICVVLSCVSWWGGFPFLASVLYITCMYMHRCMCCGVRRVCTYMYVVCLCMQAMQWLSGLDCTCSSWGWPWWLESLSWLS